MATIYNKPLYFKKEFKYKTRKQRDALLEKALIFSSLYFVDMTRKDFDERIHISFSWLSLTKNLAKILSLAIIIIMIMNFGNRISGIQLLLETITFGCSLISFGLSRYFKVQIENLQFDKSFLLSMFEADNYACVEEERQRVLSEL